MLTPLQAGQIPSFLRRYRLSGSRFLGMRIRPQKHQNPLVEIRLSVRLIDATATGKPTRTRLRIVLTDASEYRFQKRPNADKQVLRRIDLAYLSGQFFFCLDSYLEENERPAIHDFRASDAYVAASEMAYEILPPKPKASQ
ncbi:hypothetical protein [Tuwongella immobilis]|uniref:Uncharacterized protein n=1 Tax=Tuwongella immobilis TaxID=692036 RepID=A0A6C2YQ67_9BACT|nr:hypothetical protein [Tuwongella immobilis]VIP03616.1 unnamed protein product [Tuwongella immobilis]VTS04600.1 unnamed protein product [Tuwongella immobilis]